ncbi:TPA: hypothetical protein EYP44_01520, partial [Candidatus Bathyarchaeota archaeon]|nr:hypothetical protein [Candidatus Bathyarchaeota archaeon]
MGARRAVIDRVLARAIINSRGNPTIEVDVVTGGGIIGRASAPSGASRGRYEVVDFPEGGVKAAIEAVNRVVAPALAGLCVTDQRAVDLTLHEVDGTANFGRIGGNTAYAVSLA